MKLRDLAFSGADIWHEKDVRTYGPGAPGGLGGGSGCGCDLNFFCGSGSGSGSGDGGGSGGEGNGNGHGFGRSCTAGEPRDVLMWGWP